MNICKIEGCTANVCARKLCSRHYQMFQADGTLDVVSPPTQHKLSDINPDTKIALCSICGPMRAYKKGDRWRCKNTQHFPKKYGDGKFIQKHEMTEAIVRLTAEQNNRCAICNQPESSDRYLALDHCHETGKIRGLLCYRHNTALGDFGDNIAGLTNALNYLRKAEGLDPIPIPIP